MPASVALDAAGKPTVALQRKLAALGRPQLADRWPHAVEGSDRLTRESDGKADALFLHSIAKGSPLQAGLQTALDDTLAQLPIPKVMSYAGGNGYYNDVKFVRPAHRLLALHGADVVAGDRARPRGGPPDRRPPLPVPRRHRRRDRRRLRGNAARRRQGDRRLRRAARGDRRGARAGCRRRHGHHARCAARRGDRAGRVAGRLRGRVRSGVPGGAAGMPDPDDAAEPEVFRAGRHRRPARAALPRRQQHRDAGSGGDHPGQRARAARAARRRAILLRPGPEDPARRARAEARERRLPQQARHPARPRDAARASSPARSPR